MSTPAVQRIQKPIDEPLRRPVRHLLPFGILVVLLALTGGVLFFAYSNFQVTSFAVVAQTTSLRFIAARAAVDNDDNDGGLFAPSGIVDAIVEGCSKLEALNGAQSVGAQGSDAHCRLDQVRMNTLLFGPGTEVAISVGSGTTKLWMKENGAASSIRVIFDGTGKQRGQQWSVSPAHSVLTLFLTEEEKDALKTDTNIQLEKTSTLYFEGKDEESALVGTNNVLFVPRLDKKIKLAESRLLVQDLTSGRIRKVSWNRSSSNKLTSLSVTITGQSKQISVYGPYSDQPSNEALNYFDYYTHGRPARFIAVLLGFIVTLSSCSLLVTSGKWAYQQLTSEVRFRKLGDHSGDLEV